jgi:hypothetical protein
MKKVKSMALVFIIAGIVVVGIGTFLSIYGQSLKNNQRFENLNIQLTEQTEKTNSLLASNKELLGDNKSLKQKIEFQTELISESKEEVQRLKNIGVLQLRSIYYTEELNQVVKAIFIRFKLKQKTSFSDLCPLKFGIQFSASKQPNINFRNLIKDYEYWNINNRYTSYQVFDISQDSKPTINQSAIELKTEISVDILTIMVLKPNHMQGIVRDFHDEEFIAYLPNKLLEMTDTIQLIVNGWVILDEKVEKVEWELDKSSWFDLAGEEMVLRRPVNDKYYSCSFVSPWVINLYGRIPDYDKTLSSSRDFNISPDGKNIINL